MPDISKLQELLSKQNKLVEEIAAETSSLTSDGLLHEVERLKTENEALKKKCAEAEEAQSVLASANRNLRETLQHQMHAERASILNTSEGRLCAYFGASERASVNKLTELEQEVKRKFDAERRHLDLYAGQIQQSLYEKTHALEAEINAEIERLKQACHNNAMQAANAHHEAVAPMYQAPITSQTTGQVIQKSDSKLERVVGLRILSSIGATLMLLGMVTLAYFLNDYIPNAVSILLFTVATAVLGTGLFLNRKQDARTMFTITILCIGVGLEYAALTVSYFAFGLNMWAALGICTAVTVAAYWISLKMKSEPIAMFAQIGGYIPILTLFESFFSGAIDMGVLYGAMVYFLVLNVLGFVLSSKYKWQILNYVAFGLNIFAVVSLAGGVAVLQDDKTVFTLAEGMTLAFMFVSFALHTLLPSFTNIRNRVKFTRPDFILMALTTTVNLVLFYVMFHSYGIEDYTGYLSLFFAAFYFGLYALIRKFFVSDISVRTLFWLTGIVFTALFVPMQFDERWISFGWILESAVIVCYGILREKRFTFWTGVALSVISGYAFFFLDVIFNHNMVAKHNIYIYKHLLLTLASIAVLAAFIYKKQLTLGYLGGNKRVYLSKRIGAVDGYAAAVYLNAAAFLLNVVYKIFDASGANIAVIGNMRYLMLALMIAVLFFFTVIVPRLFACYAVRGVSVAVGFISLVFLLVINSIQLPAFQPLDVGLVVTTDGLPLDAPNNIGERVVAMFMVGTISALSVYVFYDMFIHFTLLQDQPSALRALAVAVGAYIVFTYSHILWQQFRLEFTHVAIAIGYILTALVGVATGLYRRNALTRRCSLILAGIAVFKLLVIDTWSLSLVYRFIGYFALGAILIGMGFLYQLFYKRFEKNRPTDESAADSSCDTQPEKSELPE